MENNNVEPYSQHGVQNRVKLESQPLDLEKPGLAQHYCVECAKYVHPNTYFGRNADVPFDRYFETDHALRSHWRTKVHKRRVKQLREPAYTIEESERAAGLGRELRPNVTLPDLMEISVE